MFNLNYLNIDLNKAREEHFNFFACFITKKLTGKKCVVSSENLSHPNRPSFCERYNNKKFRYVRQKTFFRDFLFKENNLHILLLGNPHELTKINKNFIDEFDKLFGKGIYNRYIKTSEGKKSKFKPKKVHQFFMDLKAVINYDILSEDKDYNSYKLTENLGVRSCIYCNRTYALTHRKRESGRLMNPQLDHWFPQSKFPLLQISFHNLIPSCEVCNSRVKTDKPFDIATDFHPYQDDKEKIVFGYRFGAVENKYHVFFKDCSDSKMKFTSEKMCIDQMYEAHSEELNDMITLKREYSDTYLKSLRQAFPSANLTDELMYRLAFGTELMEENFHRRPFSKFKYDILKELGIIQADIK